MPTYLLRLEPVRPEMPGAPTPGEAAAVAAHFAHLQAAWRAGRVHFCGRTETAPFVGHAVFEAADGSAAEAFAATDPAVAAGVFRAAVQPYRVVFAAPPKTESA